jgi:TolA-binding protein
MKNKIITFIAAIFIASALVISCDSENKDVEDARKDLQTSKDNVGEANLHLTQAILDSTSEFQKFQNESNDRIDGYEKKLEEMKSKITNEKHKNKTTYQRTINNLEKKTTELKSDLKNIKENEKEKWADFKVKFNHDMDDLGISIANFFSKPKN